MLKGSIINDIEDEHEILAMNKKRERSETGEEKNRGRDNTKYEDSEVNKKIPFKMNQALLESEGIDFDKEIVEAFNHFLKGENKLFLDNFTRLESHKNSKTNVIKVEKVEDAYVEDNFVHLHDEESENEREEFEKYKTNDEYYNKSADMKKRKIEMHEGMENLTNKMKDELGNLKKYDEFEKSINSLQVRKGENMYDVESAPLNKRQEERVEKRQEKKKFIVLSLCTRCMGGKLNNYSVISSSENVYLAYPSISGSITDFHLVLCPKEHINSLAAVEENVYEEVRNYMKSIVAMNLDKDMATVFVEHSREAAQITHFEIECIPIKYKLLEDARLKFKKAFSDQDDEWTTNKNLIDTTPYKGNLTKILNEKFAYVNVDFLAQGGFLHPIERNSRFSSSFLREIFADLLGKTVYDMKYPKKIGLKELIDAVEDYKNRFSYYDWTKYSA